MNLKTSLTIALLMAGCIGTPPGQDTSDAETTADMAADTTNSPDGRDVGGDAAIDDGGGGDGGGGDGGGVDADACVPSTCEELQTCGDVDDGCGTTLQCDPCAEPDVIRTNLTSVTLLVGETFDRLQYQVRDTNDDEIPNEPVSFSSMDNLVATVDANGSITAVGVGSTQIVISHDVAQNATIEVAVESGWSAVAAGHSHTCGLTVSGRAYCWGNGFTNAVAAPPNQVYPTPQRVDGRDVALAEIAVGQNHSCAIEEDGMTIRCWGSDAWGQVVSDRQVQLTPHSVTIGGTPPYHGLAAGLYHNCVVDDLDDLYCWGRNEDGQSDDESANDIVPPTAITLSAKFLGAAGGLAFTCSMPLNGDLLCWGSDGNGELGDAEAGTAASARRTIRLESTDVDLTKVTAFDGHACGLVDDGRVVCWGLNAAGQVLPTSAETPIQNPSVLFDGTLFVDVAVGARHSCAVTKSDETRLACWGANQASGGNYDVVGLLGSDDPGVSTNELTFPHEVVDLALGWYHSCAVLSDGTIRCWGDNTDGQLGNGTTNDSFEPVVVGFN